MAVTFIVEDGTGVTGANSYVEVVTPDDVQDYLDEYALDQDDLWENASDAAKQTAARIATQYVDDLGCNDNYIGDKKLETQGLRWPRVSAEVSNFILDPDTVPLKITQAVSSLCVIALDGPIYVDNFSDAQNNLSRKKIQLGAGGGIVVDRTFAPSVNKNTKIFQQVDALLCDLLLGGGEGVIAIRRG